MFDNIIHFKLYCVSKTLFTNKYVYFWTWQCYILCCTYHSLCCQDSSSFVNMNHLQYVNNNISVVWYWIVRCWFEWCCLLTQPRYCNHWLQHPREMSLLLCCFWQTKAPFRLHDHCCSTKRVESHTMVIDQGESIENSRGTYHSGRARRISSEIVLLV